MVTCPSSPAKPSSPDQSFPSRIIPPPNPVPRVIMIMEPEPLPAPSRCSAKAAREASFSMKTGAESPVFSESAAAKGKSFTPAMFGACVRMPLLRSTVPGTPIPTAQSPSPPISFIRSARLSMRRPTPSRAPERVSFSASASPVSVTSLPLRLVPPMSMPRNFRSIF